MSKPALKLVKPKKKSATKRTPKPNGKQSRFSDYRLPITNFLPSSLTPAERAEAARFRALTKQRAARQAKVRRIMAKLNEIDNQVPDAA